MRKLIVSMLVAGAAFGAGSLAMASTTTSKASEFSFSINQVHLTQSDWGSVSGKGYTALAECPAGQEYVNAFLVSEDTSGAYNVPSDFTVYAHNDASGGVDGIYLNTAVGTGGQGNGTVEIICAD